MLIKDAPAGTIVEILDSIHGELVGTGRIYRVEGGMDSYGTIRARKRFGNGHVWGLYPNLECRDVSRDIDRPDWTF